MRSINPLTEVVNMNIDERVYELELTQRQLGTIPMNRDIYDDYVGSRADDVEKAAEESETVKESEEKGNTGFLVDEIGVCIYDYMVRGCL